MSAREGADSVYRFIERTAEPVDCGVRWQTQDYENRPSYHYCAFNGGGGIGIFLAEYGRATGQQAAIDLAREANRWCSTVGPQGYASDFSPQRGLLTGRTGAALGWVYLSAITGEPVSEHAIANADLIMTHDPGPVTDLMGGAASNGFFLLRLWEATQDSRFLDGARRNGEWLCDQLTRDERGCHCLCFVDGSFGRNPFLGAAHGISGVAHFLLLLHQATGESDWADAAREILATLEQHAIEDRGGLNWAATLGSRELNRCQWSHGAPGIGITFVKAYRAELPEGDAWPTDEPGHWSQDFFYGASGLGHYFLRVFDPHGVRMPFM